MKELILFILFFSPAARGAAPLEELLFENQNSGVQTDSLIISKNEQILFENYARGYKPEMKQLSWSMAKTISGILVAQAIDQGLFKLDDRVSDVLPGFKGRGLIIDFLRMSSGIAFKEHYSGIPVDADVVKMLYLDGPNWGVTQFGLSRPLRKEAPGEYFYYASGDTNILMGLLQKKLEPKAYEDFPWEHFFDHLGIDATIERDSQGTFIGSSYMYMTARDYLKVGQLLANKGVWQGRQIIPQWYFQLMNEVAPGVNKKPVYGASYDRAYSAQVTLNKPIPGRGLPSTYPHLPLDSLILFGHQGKIIVASPSENLVIVRLATDVGGALYKTTIFESVYNFMKTNNSDFIAVKDQNRPLQEKTDAKSVPVTEPSGDKPSFWDYLKIPLLVRRVTSKEICSCVFVIKRDLKTCKKDLKFLFPVTAFVSIDQERKEVAAYFIPFVQSKAIYKGEKWGCTLVD